MHRIFSLIAVVSLALLPACAASPGASSPATAGATAPPGLAPLAATTVDDQAIRFGFEALDTMRTVVDALLAAGVVKPGTPQARAIADGLDGTRRWLNTASSLQRAGQASNAFAAWQQAQAGLANLRLAITQK